MLRTDEEKEYAFEYAKKIADKFDAKKYLNAPRPYPTTLAQKMYGYAMPRPVSYTHLYGADFDRRSRVFRHFTRMDGSNRDFCHCGD